MPRWRACVCAWPLSTLASPSARRSRQGRLRRALSRRYRHAFAKHSRDSAFSYCANAEWLTGFRRWDFRIARCRWNLKPQPCGLTICRSHLLTGWLSVWRNGSGFHHRIDRGVGPCAPVEGRRFCERAAAFCRLVDSFLADGGGTSAEYCERHPADTRRVPVGRYVAAVSRGSMACDFERSGCKMGCAQCEFRRSWKTRAGRCGLAPAAA